MSLRKTNKGIFLLSSQNEEEREKSLSSENEKRLYIYVSSFATLTYALSSYGRIGLKAEPYPLRTKDREPLPFFANFQKNKKGCREVVV